MHRHHLLLLLVAAALPAFGPVATAAPASRVGALPVASAGALTVALRPDAALAELRRLVLQPAADAAGVTIVLVRWDGGLPAGGLPTSRLPTGRLPTGRLPKAGPELVEADAATLQAGCAAGRFDAAAWPAPLRAGLIAGSGGGCVLGVATRSTVLAWDHDRLPTTPSWGDFWDVARHPGRRGLQRGPRGNLEIALLADGVAAGDVYRTLATPAGLDRAFRKLDQLRPYIVWWRGDDEPARLLASGGVLLTTAPAERILQARPAHANLALTYGQSLFAVDGWALAGPAGEALARRLGAELVSPGRLAAYASAAGLGSAADAARVSAALRIDEAFWAANAAGLAARFDGWLRS